VVAPHLYAALHVLWKCVYRVPVNGVCSPLLSVDFTKTGEAALKDILFVFVCVYVCITSD
jgi:hypothetical protein